MMKITPEVLGYLRKNPVDHCWVLQDFSLWPEATQFFSAGEPGSEGFAYLLRTGHPAIRKFPVYLLRGNPDAAAELLRAHNTSERFLVRETPAVHLPGILKVAPGADSYLEYKMEVDRASFRAAGSADVIDRVRRLSLEDANALARFMGAPPQAAGEFSNWIRGAIIFGVFEGERLVSMASTMLRIPEVWNIVAVRTLPEYQGRGLATAVMSKITSAALEAAPVCTLAVLQDNQPALSVYRKLGFRVREDIVWVDHGTNQKP